MKKEELIKQLEELAEMTNNDDGAYIDLEEPHYEADDLLLEYINDPEITFLFHKINKWYS